MTLEGAKALLSENKIPFETCEFENESAFLHHLDDFALVAKGTDCKVVALVLPGNNGKYNIELEFTEIDGEFRFWDLFFGGCGFELFTYDEEILADVLLEHIEKIRSGQFVVISLQTFKKKKWLADRVFDMTEEEDAEFEKIELEETMKRIRKPKGFFSKLFCTKKQYKIYDWNTYQSIVK